MTSYQGSIDSEQKTPPYSTDEHKKHEKVNLEILGGITCSEEDSTLRKSTEVYRVISDGVISIFFKSQTEPERTHQRVGDHYNSTANGYSQQNNGTQ